MKYKLYESNLHYSDNSKAIVFRLNKLNYSLCNSCGGLNTHTNIFPHIFMYSLGLKRFIGHQGYSLKDFEMISITNTNGTPVKLSEVMENATVIDDYRTFDEVLEDVKNELPEYFI